MGTTVIALVEQLTDKTFDASIAAANATGILVDFYLPWCGACINFAPVFEKVADELKNRGNVIAAKVDASEHNGLVKRFKLAGFPSVLYFIDGNTYTYKLTAARDVKDIIKFVQGTYLTESASMLPQKRDTHVRKGSAGKDKKKDTKRKMALLDQSKRLKSEMKSKQLENASIFRNAIEASKFGVA
jgi:protein disulfide-isomerase-like protein